MKFVETINHEKLLHVILNLDKYKEQFKTTRGYDVEQQCNIIKTYYTQLNSEGSHVVVYKQKIPGQGRFTSTSHSLQGIPRYIRHLVANDSYIDIDMVNAHPTLLAKYCDDHEIPCTLLKEYINDRENTLKKLPLDREDAKRAFLKIINNGAVIPELEDFGKEISNIIDELIKINPELYEYSVKVNEDRDFNNPRGSLINYIMCDLENDALMYIVDFCKAHNITIGALCYDGLLVKKGEWNAAETIAAMEKDLQAKTGNTMLKLKEKVMDEALEIPSPLTTDDLTTDSIPFKFYINMYKLGLAQATKLYKKKNCSEEPKEIEEPEDEEDAVTSPDGRTDAKFKADNKKIWRDYRRALNARAKEMAADAKRIEKDIANLEIETFTKWYKWCMTDMGKYVAVITGSAKPYVNIRFKHCDAETLCVYPVYEQKLLINFKDTYTNYNVKVNGDIRNIAAMYINYEDRVEYAWDSFSATTKPNKQQLLEHIAITERVSDEVEYDEEAVNRMTAFLQREFCGGDEKVYTVLIQWLAHLVQQPGVKMGYSLALRSQEGTGKGILAGLMSKVLGSRYFYHPSDLTSILGQFNSPLDNRLLVFCDEIMFAGSHTESNVLKKLITETTRSSNMKHGCQREVDNSFNIIMASNNSWIADVSSSNRRFLVLDVLNGLTKEDSTYKEQLANTCARSWGKFLYSVDLSDFDKDKIVVSTSGIKNQKIESLKSVHAWLYDVLDRGYIINENDLTLYWSKDSLFKTYQDQTKGSYQPAKRVSSFMTDLNTIFETPIKRVSEKDDDGNRVQLRRVVLPSLTEMIEAFNACYKCEMITA